jgi:hypothetical protein
VALFGKTLSATQQALITSTWRQATVYVMLDSDAQPEAQKICNALRDKVRACVKVELPAGKDPGNLTHQEIQELLAKSQRDQPPLLDQAEKPQAPLTMPEIAIGPRLPRPENDQAPQMAPNRHRTKYDTPVVFVSRCSHQLATTRPDPMRGLSAISCCNELSGDTVCHYTEAKGAQP